MVIMDNIIIRQANKSDISAIERLSLELIGATEDNEGFDINEVSKNCRHFLRDDNYYILVAELDGNLVGLISFTTYRTLLHPDLSGLPCELIVTESHRRKGVGTKLMQSFIEECKGLGCCEVEINTGLNNNRAMDFYRKLGFEERGIVFEKDL